MIIVIALVVVVGCSISTHIHHIFVYFADIMMLMPNFSCSCLLDEAI